MFRQFSYPLNNNFFAESMVKTFMSTFTQKFKKYKVLTFKMDNLLRKLVSPFSHLETSYLPVMTWLTKWSIRSFSIPITSEPGSKEFSVIKKIRHWVIYVCTALLWFFYNVTYSFWFYKNIYNSHGSLPIWQKVIAFYFLISYDMIFVLHICLLFRKRELPQVLKTCVWMEAKCISRGKFYS